MLEYHRLFVALPIPNDIAEVLYKLKALFPTRRFSLNPHLTLFFIPQAEDIEKFKNALKSITAKSFELILSGMGTFGGRVLWVGVEPCAGLLELQKKVAINMEELGETKEDRPYRPHITLARLKSPLTREEKINVQDTKCSGEWRAINFNLYESVLRPGQAVHQILASYPLLT